MNSKFERYLEGLIREEYIVHQAMNYSLLARSKRIRPLLMLTLLQDLGVSEEQMERYFPVAAAIECVHTYSLIHDDLPAFDDDDYRRGQLSCHRKFGEETAILAGDALLTDAFDLVAGSDFDPDRKVKVISLLSRCAGSNGMIKGQALDMQFEGRRVALDNLVAMDELKTGRLLMLPLLCALVLTGHDEYYDLFSKVGKLIGIAFQIQDDILDVTSSSQQLGKSTSDRENDKVTYVSLLGIDEAKEKVNDLFSQVRDLLAGKYPEIQKLLDRIEKRTW